MPKPAYYLPFFGGLIGPFGTSVVVPMFGEMRQAFNLSVEQIALTYGLYFLPFAVLLVVSGTVGERLGRQRVLRAAFALYGLASLLCALAPSLSVLLVGRLLQGSSNAFVTPLLLAGLVDAVTDSEAGGVVGTYGLFQSLGGLLAPVAGGLAAATNWRLAFLFVAMVSLALVTTAPADGAVTSKAKASFRSLHTRQMGLLGAGTFLMAFGPVGAVVLVGIKLDDGFGVSGLTAGAVLACGSLAAMIASPAAGRLVERIGMARSLGWFTVAVVVSVLALAAATTVSSLLLVWCATAASSIAMAVIFQGLAAQAVPSNRGGAISTVLAFRFLGHGVGPLIWAPLMTGNARWAFGGSAVIAFPAALLLYLATQPRAPKFGQAPSISP